MNESDRILLLRVGGGGALSPNIQQGYVPPVVCDPFPLSRTCIRI